MTRAADVLVALAFPQGCHVCGQAVLRRADGVACARCWEDSEVTPLYAESECCERCGAPGTGRCDPCVSSDVTAARAVGTYAGAIRATLLDLKRRANACSRLLDLLAAASAMATGLETADVIVPVPLHPERLRARGHNQADVLARGVAKRLDIASVENALARVRSTTERRAGLGREARAAAVRRAFRASEGLVAGKRVLVVDDLFTTGATLGACAHALREAGAVGVYGVTAARVRLNR